jgi:hypothetical protein
MTVSSRNAFGDVAFVFPIRPVYRPDLIGVAGILLKRAAQGIALSPDETDIALTGLISRVRGMLFGVEPENLAHVSLAGLCGWAQTSSFYLLSDYGLKGRPGVFQAALGKRTHRHHSYLTLELPTTAGPRWFLIDATYQQFCVSKDAMSPSRFFPQAQALVNHGFVGLDAQVAMDYTRAFNGGRALFWRKEAALAFMKNPHPHIHNVWYLRGEVFADPKTLPADIIGRGGKARFPLMQAMKF